MRYDTTKYAYAVGRIRVLETHLLRHSDMERMIGAKNPEEALKVLQDLDFENHSGAEPNKPERFHEIISIHLREVKALLEKITPYPDILNLLWLSFDLHNIKTILRSKYKKLSEQVTETHLINIGSVSHHLLQKYIVEGTYPEKLPADLKKIIDDAIALYANCEDMQIVDNFLDNQFFLLIQKITNESQNSFLKDLYTLIIDIENLKKAVRVKHLSDRVSSTKNIFTAEGDISKTILDEYLKKENMEAADMFIVEKLQSTVYGKPLHKGIEKLREEGILSPLELELESLIVRHLRKAKIIVYGPEPVFAYFLSKINNAQIIRTIMVGKINGLKEQQIRSMLRELYT